MDPASAPASAWAGLVGLLGLLRVLGLLGITGFWIPGAGAAGAFGALGRWNHPRPGLRRCTWLGWSGLAGLPLLVGTVAAAAPPPVAEVRVDFDRGGVTRVIARGWADRAAERPITVDDPVRIASVSKLVLTIGLMRLVEQGSLDLDRDAGDYLGWSLRHPRHAGVPITLRLLLSHRSGLTDEAGYASNVATLTRELVGRPGAWDTGHAPGTFFRYSNLNFPLVAAVMERVTGERLDRLMDRLVLDPLGIDGCFNWAACPDAAILRAVVVYDATGKVGVDDLHGNRPPCPVLPAPDGSCNLDAVRPGDNGGLFSPQGGLRISGRELAKIGRLLLNGGEVDGVRLLRPSTVEQMLRPVWTFDGSNGLGYETDVGDPGGTLFCRYGLAAQTLATPFAGCRDDPWGDGVERVGHSGDAYGLVSGLWIDRGSGRGVAYFITGGDLQRKGRRSAFYAVEEELLAR